MTNVADSAPPRDRAPASYVDPAVTEPRLARQWAAIAETLPHARAANRALTRRMAIAIACIAVLVAAVGLRLRFGSSRGDAPVAWEGRSIDSAATARTVMLPDGSSLDLAAQTLVRIALWRSDRVAIELEHGTVTMDVAHVAGRAWSTRAGPFEVRVVGTRFTVRRDPATGSVAVEVARGRVEVARADAPDQVRSLGAGESWTGADAAVAEPPRDMAEHDDGPPEPAAIETSAPEPAAPTVPRWEALAHERRYAEAYDALGAEGFARAVDASAPKRLLLLGEVARAAGRLSDAERAFDALRTKHRGDARAGLAAFELGRLRLDALGKPAAAAEAFADAIALSPGGPFREDAEARRVDALARAGELAACASARDAYLARYPDGPHAALVRRQCVRR